MHTDEVWKAIDSQRTRVADLLDGLADDEWDQPSLCGGWTVRDVAAHLTLQQLTLGDAARLAARSPGGLRRITREAARRRAAAPTARLVAEIRATAGSRRHNAGVTCRETLIDILVHGLDIAVPLGRALEVPGDAAAEAATRVWELAFPFFGYPFHPRRRLRGLRLAATDTDWAVGRGQLAEGPMAALLLLLTGRAAALPQLTGPGAATLRSAAR
jgi:uncharacterized protein (TIGR03083 family)